MKLIDNKIQQLRNLDRQLKEKQKKLSGWKASLVNIDNAVRSGEVVDDLSDIKIDNVHISGIYY